MPYPWEEEKFLLGQEKKIGQERAPGLIPDDMLSIFRGTSQGSQKVPLESGNIDLMNRPVVRHPDGQISTVRSMSVNIDGQEVLLPTISDDGRLLSPEEAIQEYKRTGKHLGKFASPEEATAYAQKLHEEQDRLYSEAPKSLGGTGVVPSEMLSIFTATPGTKPSPTGAPSDEAETLARLERQASRIARQYEPPVERSMAGEIGTSIARGALGIAKLPFEVAKIAGADVLGSQTVRRALEPILFGFEELAESRALRPSDAAGGKPIELDRIIDNPSDVVRQIKENVTNPRFWAAQVPEGLLSMVPYFAGNLGFRMAGQALKYGKAMEAIKASEFLSEAEKAAKLAEIGQKLARLGSIGGFGAAMAMEAGEAESRLRQWEDQTGKRVDWAPRILSILGTGLVSGGLEAISTERIFFGKHGAPPVEGMIRKLFEGKNGTILARKILDSVATEGVTEGAQELVQNLAEKLGYNPDKKLTEGIVEAVLIGAAVGGLAGTGAVAHQAIRQYAPYMQELKRRAEEERIARLPEGFTSPRTGPTAAAGLAAMEAAARAKAEEAARQAEAERIAKLPDISPAYRTTPTPAAAVAEPIPVPEQPSVPPMGDLEADILREAPMMEPEGTARPLYLTGRPMMPPEGRPLVQRLDALFRMVDETGDPRAAQEIHNLLLAHRPEVVEAFRSPDPAVGKGLRPLADRVEALYRKVEETGDVNAARQLHELLVANQQGLTKLSWEHLHRLASQPMTQSAGEVKDWVRDERLAGGEPEFLRRLETLIRLLDEEGDPRAAREIQGLITAHRPEVLRLFSLPEAGESRLGPLATQVEELYRRVEDTGDLDAARRLHELIRQNYHLLSRADRTISGLAAGPRPSAPEPETTVPEPPPTRGPLTPEVPPSVSPAPTPQAPPTIDKALEQGKPIRNDILQEYSWNEPSPKYRLTVDENIRRGREAMERVIAEHADVPGAMWREDLGDISFYWGEPGDAEKNFRGGYGVSHIIAKRNAEGEDGEAIARKMVEVIAKGEVVRRYGPPKWERVDIAYGEFIAVLSLYKDEVRETWLLTGWKRYAPGEPGSDSALSRPTHSEPTLNRLAMGAGAEEIISPVSGKGKVTQEMIQAAFPGLEVRKAKFFDGYRVLLPHQGLEIAIRLNGEIIVPDAAGLRAAGYSEEDIRGIQQNAEDYVLAGAWQVIDGGGIITLAKGEGQQTLRHEVFHAACDLVLTDKERQAILREFGDWEAAARAYETWMPTEKPHSIFQKILDFFRQIWEVFRPTWEGTFRRIERGEVWRRKPREVDVFGEPILIHTRYRVTKDDGYLGMVQVGQLTSPIFKNPPPSLLRKEALSTELNAVRGFVVPSTGDTYWWDAMIGHEKLYDPMAKLGEPHFPMDWYNHDLFMIHVINEYDGENVKTIVVRADTELIDSLLNNPKAVHNAQRYMPDIVEKLQELRKKILKASGIEQAPSREDEAQELLQKAFDHFGETTSILQGAFIAPNGKRIKVTGEHNQIGFVTGMGAVDEAIYDFLARTGSIRTGFPFPNNLVLDLPNIPTGRQMKEIVRALNFDENVKVHIQTLGPDGSFAKYQQFESARVNRGDILRFINNPDNYYPGDEPRSQREHIARILMAGGKYSIKRKDAHDLIKNYRDKYIAPTEPRESRDVISTTKGLKDKLMEKAQRFYDQVVDRWAAWERLAERAVRAGAKVPHGEHITNALSFMRGVEGRVRQGLTGEYVYQDRMDFDPDLQEVVFTGDDLVRKGPSFNRRLEPLRELAKRRNQPVAEVMDDFEVFLVAQRDLELAGEFGNRMPGEIKGVHPEESKAVISALVQKYGNDWRIMGETATSLREWSDEMILQPLLQVGFIDELTYQAIKAKNQFYAPFKRLLDQTNEYIAAHLAAQGVSGNVLKQIKGSEKQILSPLQTWIELAYKAQWAYARNKVYRAAYITGKAYEDAEVYEVPAKYVPVDFTQKQEIDPVLRQELLDLARELKVDVKVVRTLRGRRLGEFSRMIQQEVSEGLIPEGLAGQIRLRFATSEKTLSHELGHAIDDQYNLVGLLIERGTPEMRRELRRIADQRAGEADSKSYKRYVRKKTEQVAEFVNRYITDRETAKAVAPETTAVFEQFLNQHDQLKPLLNFRPSARAGLTDFQNRVWARSPLPPEPGCVPYYRDGKRRWLKLPPDLYHAAQNLMPAEMGILMQIARIPADMLRSGAILVPEFSLGRNPVRDIIQTWIFSRSGYNPLKWFRDAALLIGKDEETRELRRQWEAGGGVLSTLAESFVEPEKITAEYLKGKEGRVKYFANPLHALRYASAFFENLTRFSIYKQAREKGLSHAEAIHEARRTTLDFGRAGGHPTVRYLNTLIPFWNAAVQGMDKLVTELSGPNRKAVLRRLGVLAGLSVLIYLVAHQDDRYQELEDWERNYFWHIPIGKDAPLLRIPKPFEAGILFGSVAERLVEALVTKDIKGVKSAMAAAWDAATPEIIPTIARPYIEAKANYDFFRGRPIEDISLQRLPAGLRAKPWTTETAKAVGRLTDISPVQMEHFIRQWTGGLGANYFLPGIDLLLRKTGVVEDIPQPAQDKIQQVWGVRTFFTKPPTGWRAKSVNDFFERYQDVLLADTGWKVLWQSGDKAKVEKFLEEHPEAMYARVARKLMDEMSKVKKERQLVYASKALTPEQKREKLEALDARVVELARLGNAFMSTEAAATVKMPPSYRLEEGIRKPWKPEDYYELTARQTYEAFQQFQGRRWQDMDSDDRDALVETLLRRARREVSYEPTEKGDEDKSSVAGLLMTKKKAKEKQDQSTSVSNLLMQEEKRRKAKKFYEIGALL